MHDLNTIKRLNIEAHEKAITQWRGQGKYVVSVYEGLTLMTATPFDTADEAAREAKNAANPPQGTTVSVLPPFPYSLGSRDQSEDRAVSFATIDDYLKHVGRLPPPSTVNALEGGE